MPSTGTLVVLPGALQLVVTVPDADDTGTAGQARNDIFATLVAYSTTAGFDADTAPLKFVGERYINTIPNLAPLVPHYVRFKQIYQNGHVDEAWSTELSATPNKIDGALMADELFGKTVADAGAVLSADFLATDTSIQVNSTNGFPATGYLLLSNPFGAQYWRYASKTATSFGALTAGEYVFGNSPGAQIIAQVESLVLPVVYPPLYADSVASGATTLNITSGIASILPSSGDLILVHSGGCDFCSFTGRSPSSITGVSGVTRTGDNVRVIHDVGFPTATIPSGDVSSVTIASGSLAMFPPRGAFELFAEGASTYAPIPYDRINGGTIFLATPATLFAGTFRIAPTFSYAAMGQSVSFSSVDETGFSMISPKRALLQAAIATGSGFQTSAVFLKRQKNRLHTTFNNLAATSSDIVNSSGGDFGYSNGWFLYYDGTIHKYIQPAQSSHYFGSPEDATPDTISFSSGTYFFNSNTAALTAGNAPLAAGSLSLSSGNMVITRTGTPYTAVNLDNTGGVNTQLVANANADGRVGTISNHPFGLLSNSNFRVFVEAAGNVGVGNTAPTVRLDVSGPVRTRSSTFAGLPTAAAAGSGARAFITDCTVTGFRAVAAGGGANAVPVHSDGTNWRVG